MTDFEIKLELAKAALMGGMSVEKADEAYKWVTKQRPAAENIDNIPVSDMEDAIGKNAVRFRCRCKDNNIFTVGQLVALGKNGFRGKRLVGDGLISDISNALYIKYGISAW